MIWLPSPHPLDFDWRYDGATARWLAGMLVGQSPVLAVGSPSVARILQRAGVDVTLVDRQPVQGVLQQIACDASEFVPARSYRAALVDPPWYPAPLVSWSRVAARAVGVGGTVLVTIWPAESRPTAQAEISTLFDHLSTWAEVRRDAGVVRYDMPHFEAVARQRGRSDNLARSPLMGELVRLVITKMPAPDSPSDLTHVWRRFTVNEYQLAIRCGVGDGPSTIDRVPSADGWLWPFVSARAPCIDKIDLWSSEGEVAAVESPNHVIDTLRQALSSPDPQTFERSLAEASALLEWRIPRPPYRRFIEWLHRQ